MLRIATWGLYAADMYKSSCEMKTTQNEWVTHTTLFSDI